MNVTYGRLKAGVLRDKPRGMKVSPDWKIDLPKYRELVGECVYCGGEGYWLCRVDNGGKWEVGNVVCACGRCAGMRTGLSHADFLDRLQCIVTRLSGE